MICPIYNAELQSWGRRYHNKGKRTSIKPGSYCCSKKWYREALYHIDDVFHIDGAVKSMLQANMALEIRNMPLSIMPKKRQNGNDITKGENYNDF